MASGKKMDPKKLMALEYAGIGMTMTIIVGVVFYLGMKVGFSYGIAACP